MDIQDLIKQVERIKEITDSGAIIEATELARIYLGSDNSFYKQLNKIDPSRFYEGLIQKLFYSTIDGLLRYLKNGLQGGISLKRQAQLDIVSDFLEQAETLLKIPNIHCAAPTVIIGSALEEFLRNWIENEGFDLTGKKLGIDSYAKLLRQNKIIKT